MRMTRTSRPLSSQPQGTLVEDVLGLLGPTGTLVMPTHAVYQNADGFAAPHARRTPVVYDPARTPCGVGLANELFRRRPGVERSLHPYNTLSACGPLAAELFRDNLNGSKPLAHGVGSGYYRFCCHNGLVVSIGVPLRRCLTLVHVAEDVRDQDWPIRDYFEERSYVVRTGSDEKCWIVRQPRPGYAMFCLCLRKATRDLARAGILHESTVGGVRVDWARRTGSIRVHDGPQPDEALSLLLDLAGAKEPLSAHDAGDRSPSDVLLPRTCLAHRPKNELYVTRRYAVYRSADGGRSWTLDCCVPAPAWKALAMRVHLAARLLRYYIAAFEVLPDGSRIAVARDGIYRAGPGEVRMSRTFHVTRGSRPLNVAVDGMRVIFGEYGNFDDFPDRLTPHEVCLYVSEDGGRSFSVARRFVRGDIRHIHNVLVDPYSDCYWVFVGDYQTQPGIGRLSKDLRTLDWLGRGQQVFRAVGALMEPDCLVYGTDSNLEPNFLVRLDKRTGEVRKLRGTDGTSLYATRFGPLRVITTCIEPNPVTTVKECSLYASLDGEDWQRFFVHKKDRYHPALFQFGTLALPYSYGDRPRGMYSGQAVTGADDRVFLVEMTGAATKSKE